jgi:hypothetical protein
MADGIFASIHASTDGPDQFLRLLANASASLLPCLDRSDAQAAKDVRGIGWRLAHFAHAPLAGQSRFLGGARGTNAGQRIGVLDIIGQARQWRAGRLAACHGCDGGSVRRRSGDGVQQRVPVTPSIQCFKEGIARSHLS